jgi:hypothetical protein
MQLDRSTLLETIGRLNDLENGVSKEVKILGKEHDIIQIKEHLTNYNNKKEKYNKDNNQSDLYYLTVSKKESKQNA